MTDTELCDYLKQALRYLRSWFRALGYPLPAIKLVVRPIRPRPKPDGRRTVGYWYRPERGIHKIVVASGLNWLTALEVLVHECCHAATNSAGHVRAFGAVARSIGLDPDHEAGFAIVRASPALSTRLVLLHDRKLKGKLRRTA